MVLWHCNQLMGNFPDWTDICYTVRCGSSYYFYKMPRSFALYFQYFPKSPLPLLRIKILSCLLLILSPFPSPCFSSFCISPLIHIFLPFPSRFSWTLGILARLMGRLAEAQAVCVKCVIVESGHVPLYLEYQSVLRQARWLEIYAQHLACNLQTIQMDSTEDLLDSAFGIWIWSLRHCSIHQATDSWFLLPMWSS